LPPAATSCPGAPNPAPTAATLPPGALPRGTLARRTKATRSSKRNPVVTNPERSLERAGFVTTGERRMDARSRRHSSTLSRKIFWARSAPSSASATNASSRLSLEALAAAGAGAASAAAPPLGEGAEAFAPPTTASTPTIASTPTTAPPLGEGAEAFAAEGSILTSRWRAASSRCLAAL